MAILCLMRYEDWTFRETEVRLKEHTDLRRALSIERTPDYTTFYRFMRRLDAQVIQQALHQAAFQVLKDLPQSKTVFAVDATGLACPAKRMLISLVPACPGGLSRATSAGAAAAG